MHTRVHKKKNAGFTLVELMVTITVMLIITSVSLFNYTEFNSVTMTNNLAYDIALAVRQAQSYGIAVRANSNNTQADFDIAYGIHFSKSNNVLVFNLFADTSSEGKYDIGEELQEYKLLQGTSIEKVCITDGGCLTSDSGQYIDILFKRPDPESKISYNIERDLERVGVADKTVTITIENATKNLRKNIIVYPTGQLSIE